MTTRTVTVQPGDRHYPHYTINGTDVVVPVVEAGADVIAAGLRRLCTNGLGASTTVDGDRGCGIPCFKWRSHVGSSCTGSQATAPKTLYFDMAALGLFYSPSPKPLKKRIILLKFIKKVTLIRKGGAQHIAARDPPTSTGTTIGGGGSAPHLARGAASFRFSPRANQQSSGVFANADLFIEHSLSKKPLKLTMGDADALLAAQCISHRLSKYHEGVFLRSPFHTRLREAWLIGDEDRSGYLSLDELRKLLRTVLNMKLTQQELLQLFEEVDKDGNQKLDFGEFVALFTDLTTIKPMKGVFDYFLSPRVADEEQGEGEPDLLSATGPSSSAHSSLLRFAVTDPRQCWSIEDLQQFFVKAQGERLSRESAEGIVRLYSGPAPTLSAPAAQPQAIASRGKGSSDGSLSPENSVLMIPSSQRANSERNAMEDDRSRQRTTTTTERIPRFSFHHFCQFLVDPLRNGWFKPAHDTVFLDMTRPLHEYFIACSHNTYSTGSQFSSKSAVSMYTQVLNQGCRCVEIDIHDGAEEPMVYHHYTPTSEIFLHDVLCAVRTSAFDVSPYPVVLSLEMHTNEKQTEMVVALLLKCLGAALLRPEEILPDGSNYTPEALKGRILIKWKRSANEPVEEDPHHPNGRNNAKPFATTSAAHPQEGLETQSTISIDYHQPKSATEASTDAAARLNEAKCGAAAKLRALVTVGGVHATFPLPAISAPAERLKRMMSIESISEAKLLKRCSATPMEAVQMYCSMMGRGYPSGSRMMDSSNADPVVGWRHGVQMMAMNYQTWDEAMFIHEGFFRVNGRSGYILKPEGLRPPVSTDPTVVQLNQQQQQHAPNSSTSFGGENGAAVSPLWLPSHATGMVLTVRVLFATHLHHTTLDVDRINPFVEVVLQAAQLRKQRKSIAHGSLNATYSGGGPLSSPRLGEDGMGTEATSTLSEGGMGSPEGSSAVGSPLLGNSPQAPRMTLSHNVQRMRTKTVPGNGFQPVWNEVFDLHIALSDATSLWTTFLTIHVKDDELTGTKSVGVASLPIASLQLGYRSVPLTSPTGRPLSDAAVVCNFSLRAL